MTYQLADLFEMIVDHIPDREALTVCDEDGTATRRLTYRELDQRASQLAAHLLDSGIGKGDHVGMHLLNGSEYVEGMLACQKISAVPVNVNYRYVEEELRYLYDDADLAAVIFDADFGARVAKVAPDVKTLRHFLVVGDTQGATLPEGAVEYEVALGAQATDRVGQATRSDDDLWILYTGGTTGMPKGVMWRHEDVFFAGMGGGNPVMEPVTSPEELRERVDPAGGQLVMFAAAPLMHGAAELATYIGFWGGHRIVVIRKFNGPGVMQTIQNEGVNTISIVGDAMAIPMVKALAAGEYDASSMFVLSTAGAIMSQSVRDGLTSHLPNLMVLDSFGSSESGYGGMAADGSSPDKGLKFSMKDAFVVVSDDHEVLEPGSEIIGQCARFGHIPLGYYGDEEKTAATFPTIDGTRYVLMGDRATVDAEGVIHVLGRGSVCINSGGEKVYPEEVEAAIKAHPAIEDAIVAGIPDETWGQRVGAVVSLSPGAEAPTLEELRAHLGDRIAAYKAPRALAVEGELVRSPAGKPDYKWARQILADQAGITL